MKSSGRNLIPPQSGASFTLRKGQYLKVIDPEGQQVSDLFCFALEDFGEALSGGRSIDYNDTLFLTEGHLLYSNRSTPLLRIVQDSCGRHDFLMTPCSLRMFRIVSGTEEYHPSCHENLAVNLGPRGISPDQIGTTFNIFMHVEVGVDGKIKIAPPRSRAGDSITFLALTDLLVGLTACSHEETNHGRCKPIEYQILECLDSGT